MEPYRPLHVFEEGREEDLARGDDRALGVLLLVLGLARVVPALCLRESFGTEVTIAAVMVVVALCIFASPYMRRCRAPRHARDA